MRPFGRSAGDPEHCFAAAAAEVLRTASTRSVMKGANLVAAAIQRVR